MSQLGNNIPGPGTLVTDYLESNFLSGATLNSAGTTTGTAVEVNRPGDVAFVLELSTIGGTSPTMTISLQGSDTSDFSDDVVTLATVASSGATDDNNTYSVCAEVYKQYVRASVVLGGTSPVYTGATLKMRQPHWHRSSSTSAAPLV